MELLAIQGDSACHSLVQVTLNIWLVMCHRLEKLFRSNNSCLVMVFVGMLAKRLQCFAERGQRTADKYTWIGPMVTTRSKKNTGKTKATILLPTIHKPRIPLEPLKLKGTPICMLWKTVISTWLEMVIEQVVPLVCISDPSSNEACHITTVLSRTQSRPLSSRRTRALSLIRRRGISGWFISTEVCVCMTCTVCMITYRCKCVGSKYSLCHVPVLWIIVYWLSYFSFSITFSISYIEYPLCFYGLVKFHIFLTQSIIRSSDVQFMPYK